MPDVIPVVVVRQPLTQDDRTYAVGEVLEVAPIDAVRLLHCRAVAFVVRHRDRPPSYARADLVVESATPRKKRAYRRRALTADA